jgi:PAS domain S-box-containing protein
MARSSKQASQDADERLRKQAEELRIANERLRFSEQALRESQERFGGIVNSAMDAMVSVNEEQRIVLFNPAAEQMFGYSALEVIGQPLIRLIPERFHRAHEQHIRDYAQTGVTTRRMGSLGQVRGRRASGEEFPIEASISQIVVSGGRLFTAILRDITERVRNEEAVQELTRTLESKVAERTAQLEHRAHQLQKLTLELSQAEDQERKRLADVLHDDLQQQLAAAKFHLGILTHRIAHDPVQHAMAARIDGMLTDAIEKSRSLSHELSPAVLYQSDLCETFHWLAEQIQAKHGLVVRTHGCRELKVESDPLKAFLYKAVQELLFNVVKHARVNEASIRTRRLGRYVSLSVSDRGRGFDPHETKETAGFGLFSIRERVELIGGRMKILSAKGRGSKFIITVPDGPMTEDRGQKTEDRRDLSSVLGPPSVAHRLRVMVVDDHEIVREGLASLLGEEADIEVIGEAANGREAVNIASQLKPDVVIMDVAMPLMNGDEAPRQIRGHLPGTRVVALSMYEEDNMIDRMRRAGAESYILKTSPSEELLTAVRGKPQ